MEKWKQNLFDKIINSFDNDELDKETVKTRKIIFKAIAENRKEEVKHLKLYPEYLIGYLYLPDRQKEYRVEYWTHYGVVVPELFTTNGNVHVIVNNVPENTVFRSINED